MIRVPTIFLPAPLTSQQPHLLIRTNDSYSHADSSCLLVSDHKQPKVPKGSQSLEFNLYCPLVK